MGDDVGAVIADVLRQETQDVGVVGLHQTVTSGRAIAAEHYQIGSDVIPGVLEHMVQGEPPAVLQADRALAPFEMEIPEEIPIPNAPFLLEVTQMPHILRVLGQGPKPRVSYAFSAAASCAHTGQ